MVAATRTKKNKRKSKQNRSCRVCGYTSERPYNVLRHEQRIHNVQRFIECCGSTYATKGEYYVHAESIHPEKRRSWKIVTTKYKIISSGDRRIARSLSSSDRSSTSASSCSTSSTSSCSASTSLSLVAETRTTTMANSIRTSRMQRGNSTRNAENDVIVSIQGGANADAISEYLGDIDFDSFRISVRHVQRSCRSD